MIKGFFGLVSAVLFLGWATSTLAQAAPVVVSITPASAAPSSAVSELFTVVFSEVVTGVDTSDFVLTTTGTTAHIGSISGSGTTYRVTVTAISGVGTIRLDLKSGTDIQNGASVAIAGGFTTGVPRTVIAAVPVPTLSEWALILFGALIAGAGGLYLQQRRLAV